MLMTDESLTRQTTSVQPLSMQYRPKLRSKAWTWPLKLFSHARKDGNSTTIGEEDKVEDEEMFACEVRDGLVKASDTKCPHCGAIFEEEEEVVEQTRIASRLLSRSGPPGFEEEDHLDLQNPDRLDH